MVESKEFNIAFPLAMQAGDTPPAVFQLESPTLLEYQGGCNQTAQVALQYAAGRRVPQQF